MFLFRQRSDNKPLKEKIEKACQQITKSGGTVVKTQELEQNTLVRPLKKENSVSFVLVDFEISPEKVNELKKSYKLNEDILRVQIIAIRKTGQQDITQSKHEENLPKDKAIS